MARVSPSEGDALDQSIPFFMYEENNGMCEVWEQKA
jgi:hypothetical protein